MLNRFLVFSLAAAFLSVFFCANATLASESDYNKAVDLYLKNSFEKALPEFQALNKAEPANENVHYYLALCYQRIKEDDKAAAEYTWILKNTKNSAFKEIIQERIKRVNHTKIDDNVKTNIAANHEPVRKVILFSTNWCGDCRKFQPSWDKTEAEFKGRIVFEHLNAEDPSQKELVDKYKPYAYPTLVYLDAKNNVIENHADGPGGDLFAKHLRELGADK